MSSTLTVVDTVKSKGAKKKMTDMNRMAAQSHGGKGGKKKHGGSKTREGVNVTSAQHDAHKKPGKKGKK